MKKTPQQSTRDRMDRASRKTPDTTRPKSPTGQMAHTPLPGEARNFLTPKQCAEQFRMYARTVDRRPAHSLNFAADFLDEYCQQAQSASVAPESEAVVGVARKAAETFRYKWMSGSPPQALEQLTREIASAIAQHSAALNASHNVLQNMNESRRQRLFALQASHDELLEAAQDAVTVLAGYGSKGGTIETLRLAIKKATAKCAKKAIEDLGK